MGKKKSTLLQKDLIVYNVLVWKSTLLSIWGTTTLFEAISWEGRCEKMNTRPPTCGLESMGASNKRWEYFVKTMHAP